MKLIESDVKFLKQEFGLKGLQEHIENCGRTCYKSENNIKEGSAEKFVNAMIKSHHGAMLEHGTVYLKDISWDGSRLEKYKKNQYSYYKSVYLEKEEVEDGNDYDVSYKYGYYVTTNYRVLVENGWLSDLQYLCEPTEYHEKRYTLRFICDRGVTHELVRHRKFSFAQESSRYCNYGSENKFGKELTFILPSWIDYKEMMENAEKVNGCTISQQHSLVEKMLENNFATEPKDEAEKNDWELKRCKMMMILNMLESERYYMFLIEHGYKPQQARHVLPTMIKSEICMTGFASDWRFFFDLRLFGKTGEPHPDMLRVAKIAKEKFEEAGEWDNIMSYKSKFE